MTSDILTKSLAPAPFTHHRKNLLGMQVSDVVHEDELLTMLKELAG